MEHQGMSENNPDLKVFKPALINYKWKDAFPSQLLYFFLD